MVSDFPCVFFGDTLMVTTPAQAPQRMKLIHSSFGRLRIHFPQWKGEGEYLLETRIRQQPGIIKAEANSITRNVLIVYNPAATTEEKLLTFLNDFQPENGTFSGNDPVSAGEPGPASEAPRVSRSKTSSIPVLHTGKHNRWSTRIAVRGLDRDPQLGKRLVQKLQKDHGIQARTNPLTGWLMVDFDKDRTKFEDVLAVVTHMELPELPEEDRPEHPLDPKPLFQSATRALGALVGLGVLTVIRIINPTPPFSGNPGIAGTVAGVLNIMQGFPLIRNGLRELFGWHAADLIANGSSMAALTAANSPLGLITLGVESTLLFEEVTARRAGWRRYEEMLDGSSRAEPGAVLRLEAGMRVPGLAKVIEGSGTATSRAGMPINLSPGGTVQSGAILSGGPFVLELLGGEPFVPKKRPVPPAKTFLNHYLTVASLSSLGYSALAYLGTGSINRAFEGLLLFNPRVAVIGTEVANLQAAARLMRGGMTVVGTRPDRVVRLPNIIMLDSPRLVVTGLGITKIFPRESIATRNQLFTIASLISIAAGSPWGSFGQPLDDSEGTLHSNLPTNVQAREGSFNGLWARAHIDGVPYVLGPPEDELWLAEETVEANLGGYFLELRQVMDEDNPISYGYVLLKPQLNPQLQHLVNTCRKHHVTLEMFQGGTHTLAEDMARAAGVVILDKSHQSAIEVIHAHQEEGKRVCYVADNVEAAPAFTTADLAIGMCCQRGSPFPARADVLAPDLLALADYVEAGALRKLAIRDSVLISGITNVVGAAVGLIGPLGVERATIGIYSGTLLAIAATRYRLRGGTRAGAALAHLNDPRPERWGRRSVASLLRSFNTTPQGLSSIEAASRHQPRAQASENTELMTALRNQLTAPITLILAGGAGLTLILGQALNTSILITTISMNVAAGVWQERQVGKASEALSRLGAATCRVIRDETVVEIPTQDLVCGDVLVLMPGDRVAADARLISASSLEVDEAPLTGESHPVIKGPEEGLDTSRVVLEGSDVVVGTGRAVVIAVGRGTRLGSTASALEIDSLTESPLGNRLGQILKIALPVAGIGGVLTTVAGFIYGGIQNPAQQISLGVSTGLSAIPEGLPLLAGVGQAAVASRLAKKNALVRRVAAIEAMGRVDVACTDKTGTLTEGRLTLRMLATMDGEVHFPTEQLSEAYEGVLITASLACPHPDATTSAIHPTDRSIFRAAADANLDDIIRIPRDREIPFDSARAFTATVAGGKLQAKGAPERLLPRCSSYRSFGKVVEFTEQTRAYFLKRVEKLAERGLRVLLIAEGADDLPLDNPKGLTVVGLIGINDPLRVSAAAAVRRCQEAGIRVIMLTGDHPATARAIAREAGLLSQGRDEVVTAAMLAELSLEELDQRMKGVAVVARSAPLDKVRIVESLKRCKHTVAMTGDGVNDAPSLRLADVGVAMGITGTEVARQASDLILGDDDFATLVEGLVEGRGFWRNMRNGLGLLLGGNVGELGLLAGASCLGLGIPLTIPQILIVNMITDALPCLAVVLQKPQHRNLAKLSREGLNALDTDLKFDVFRRGIATAIPALAAYGFIRMTGTYEEATGTAFPAVILNQLIQTVEVGRVQGILSNSVIAAVGTSTAMLLACVTIPPLRDFLSLQTPTARSWAAIAASTAGALALSVSINGARNAILTLGERKPSLLPNRSTLLLEGPRQ